jgi:hypothetical protein
VVASAWNVWPLPTVGSCSCNSKNRNVIARVRLRVPRY